MKVDIDDSFERLAPWAPLFGVELEQRSDCIRLSGTRSDLFRFLRDWLGGDADMARELLMDADDIERELREETK
jgi:hypothetical protein